MKRFDPKNKYFGWGLTAFGVIACSILFFMLLQHGKSIRGAIDTLLGILSPIIWGMVITYLLWPLVKMFQRKLFEPLLQKIRPKKPVSKSLARALSVVLAILVALVLIAALVWLIIPQLYTSIESIVLNSQQYYDTITGWINRFFENNPEVEEALLSATGKASDSLLDWAKTALLPSMGKIVTSLTTGIYAVLLVNHALRPLLSRFLRRSLNQLVVLSNMELFMAKSKMVLYSIFPLRSSKRILKAIRFTDTAFMSFISGKVIDSAIIGVICYICCTIMRMPYVVLVSVVVGVTNIIPVFGPFIGAVPTALIILLDSPMKCLIYVIFILVLQQIDGNIIGPKILGSSTGINGFWIMFAILLGGGLFGSIGMLLGVPVFVVIYAGLEKLVSNGLKKRGLQTETAEYMDLDYIDDATLRPVRLPTEAPHAALKETKDDSVK